MSKDFIVSARKYRPNSWGTVVGQKSITATLQSAIANNQIAQAYLFCGPRGVGKTTCARIFAAEINKDAKETDQDLSFNVFELDAASNNSVDGIRSLTEQVRIPPQIGKYKVYIIDEVHMLSQAAFNAFLKTLEEPPPHAIFVLATTEKHKIIPTILSRCQIFDFQRISVPDMVEHLKEIAAKEGVEFENTALHIVAQKADGALRDALSIFDQLVAFCGNNLTYDKVIENLNVLDYDYYFKLSDFFIKEDVSSALLTLDEILNKGFDAHHFLAGLGDHLRNLMVCKDPKTVELLEVSDSIKEKYLDQSKTIEIRMLIKALDFVNTSDVQYKTSSNQRLLTEFTLIQICSIPHNMAEKKNSSFSLKPFRESNSRIQKKQIESITSKKPERPIKVVPSSKTAKKPLVVGHGPEHPYSFGSPLISDLIHPKKAKTSKVSEEEVDVEVKVKKNRDYSTDELHEVWREFAERLKKDKRSTYITLTHKMPLIEGHKVVVEIHNSIQENEVKLIRPDLLAFIKNRLHNTSLEISTVLIKDANPVKKDYTDLDKFKSMKDKNSDLEYFRNKFNLDIEF